MGMLIKFYYSYCFGLLSFKITNMWGLSQVMGAISTVKSGKTTAQDIVSRFGDNEIIELWEVV